MEVFPHPSFLNSNHLGNLDKYRPARLPLETFGATLDFATTMLLYLKQSVPFSVVWSV